MDLPDRYRDVVDDGAASPAPMLVTLPTSRGFPSRDDVERRLSELDQVTSIEPADDTDWSWGLQVKVEGLDLPWVVFAHPTSDLPESWFQWPGLDEAERDQARSGQWCVGVLGPLGHPLSDFHRQLKVLDAASDSQALALFDVAALRTHAGAWLQQVAQFSVPPAPTNLFSIHAVSPDPGQRGGTWLHTHGLLRCGVLELEILDVPREHVGTLGNFLNNIASMFLDSGTPPPDHSFEAGAHLHVTWLPWEAAIERVPRGRLGTGDDREGEEHTEPSAVLFAPAKSLFGRKYASLAKYADQLEGNPLLLVSAEETERQAQLAHDLLPRFKDLFAAHHEGDDWGFLVKLGLSFGESREHLWFGVDDLAGDRFHGTLLNEPYHVDGLHEGDQDEFELSLLTDWSIHFRGRNYGPDVLFLLQRKLDSEQGD